MAIPWMTTTLHRSATLTVQVAWGADLTDTDGSGWTWTDITTDVRVADGISVKVGAGDEASKSTPATCSLALDNLTGDYGLGGMSSNYPNVRRGTPVRVLINPGSGTVTAFLGFADGWSPEWNATGSDAVVKLAASGVLRRLAQGSAAVLSPMRRAILSSTDVVAYWPCEDGVGSQNIAVLVGTNAMTFYSPEHPGANPDAGVVPPDLAASSAFLCSDPILTLNGSELYGHVGSYTRTGTVQVRLLIDFPSGGASDSTVLVGLQCTGSTNTSISSELWEVRYKTGGALNVRGWARGSLIVDTDIAFGIDGLRGQMCLTLFQNGGNIDWRVDFLEEGADSGTYQTGTAASRYFGEAERVQINTDGGNTEVAIGHVALLTADAGVFAFLDQLNAHDGDSVTNSTDGRLARLCRENGLGLTYYDTVRPNPNSVLDDMGPQPRGALVPLLRDAEAVDHGLLWDGRDVGLSYTTRRYREAATAALTVDIAAGGVVLPFGPVDDDQGTCNQATASRSGGGAATVEDVTGPMGTAEIGVYDDSTTYAVQYDEALPHFAGWTVGLGTIEGYRYPSLTLDVAQIPDQAADVLALVPGDRIDVVNLHTLRPSVPAAAIRLVVYGWTMRLDSHRWLITLNASPFDAWGVTILEADVGSTQLAGDFAGHLDTDGATLSAAATKGATSLSVARTDSTSPLWTTTSTDYPLTLDVGGVPVVASACSGSSSPQTFTVAALPRAFVSGTSVSVWAPARLAI